MKRIRIFDATIFFISIMLYFMNNWLLNHISYNYFLSCHFNDFLAGVAFLAYVNFILSYYKTGPIRITRTAHVFALSVICSFSWEVIGPLFKESTADWLDFIAYTSGAFLYRTIDFFFLKQLKNRPFKVLSIKRPY